MMELLCHYDVIQILQFRLFTKEANLKDIIRYNIIKI